MLCSLDSYLYWKYTLRSQRLQRLEGLVDGDERGCYVTHQTLTSTTENPEFEILVGIAPCTSVQSVAESTDERITVQVFREIDRHPAL